MIRGTFQQRTFMSKQSKWVFISDSWTDENDAIALVKHRNIYLLAIPIIYFLHFPNCSQQPVGHQFQTIACKFLLYVYQKIIRYRPLIFDSGSSHYYSLFVVKSIQNSFQYGDVKGWKKVELFTIIKKKNFICLLMNRQP